MNLYFDNTNNMFSTTQSETNECVFESYERDERIGWTAGSNPAIKKGPFEIIIGTNFYPKAPHREYLCVMIKVSGVLLLPLSKAIRKAAVYYHIGERELAKQQFGLKNYTNRGPATIVQIGDQIDWAIALSELCRICNNYEKWLINEIDTLISCCIETKKEAFTDISKILELVRIYDEIVPGIIPIYRKFIDIRCLAAMKGVLDYIERGLINNCGLNNLNKEAKAKNGDMIWQYIKDYYLKVEKS